MFFLCRHILPSGTKCDAPSLRGKPFCYFHTRVHRFVGVPPSAPDGILKLPVLEDRSAIQHALAQVLDALGSAKLDPRRAGLFLYALQIASQNVERKPIVISDDPVESITHTDDGDELGPEEFGCNTPEDCVACAERETCEDYEAEDDEEDEDEKDADGEEDDEEED
jgi:hypothetical protein